MTFVFAVIAGVLVPVIVWFLIQSRVPKILSPSIYAAVVAAFFCLCIVASASYQERKVETDIKEFDLLHAGKELTGSEKEERQRLFLNIIHDTGRTFAPITGTIAGIFYFFAIWLSIVIVKRQVKGKNGNPNGTKH